MTLKLFIQAIVWFMSGMLSLALLLFLPAGTLHYPYGNLLMLTVFVPMLATGLVLAIKSPSLLQKRLSTKEKLGEQQLVIRLSGLMFIAGFFLAGLDFRFGLSLLPMKAAYAASILYLLGYALYAEVLRENAYLSRTIEVQDGQKVVDTGLYGVVRHPMYAATLLMFLSMPLMLGSLLSFVCFLAYPAIIAKRILSEEALLEAELEGYRAYKQKVRYRLIPYIW